MKKIFALCFLVLISLSLVSCEFVSYHKYEAEQSTPALLDGLRAEYLGKLKSTWQAEKYLENEKRVYAVYLLDAENELRETESEEELEAVYRKHFALIGAIPMAYDSAKREMRKIYLSENYRETEKRQLDDLYEFYESLVVNAENPEEIDKLLRLFKTKVFELKTEAQYYSEELDQLKDELYERFMVSFNYGEYRSAEREKIQEIVRRYEAEMPRISQKEEAESYYQHSVGEIADIPTASHLFDAEKSELIAKWTRKFDDFRGKYPELECKGIEELLLVMNELESAEAIERMGAEHLIAFAKELGEAHTEELSGALEVYIQNAANDDEYRDEEQNTIRAIESGFVAVLKKLESREDMLMLYEQTRSIMASLYTNEQLWAEADAEFLRKLDELYGENVLTPPINLHEASDHTELAAIIDYYAFYQTDYKSFLRDTFRVKLLYPFRDAQWEINEVYWYSELLRSAVGITADFEGESNYLVIKLIPYELATESNTDEPVGVERYDSLVEIGSDKSEQTARGDDFEDFAYLSKYEKKLGGIWNTQQLWYALEHEYIPLTVEGSPAEAALERAKEILREVVREGMSEEEKIFAIFSWFGDNVTYDNKYTKYLYPEDRTHFPDELAATLNSFHVEGALFDNLAVCCSFAKSYLVMLRIEGIEAYRITLHNYKTNAIDNLGADGYGSHAILAIRTEDGRFYYSDSEEAYLYADPSFVKYHQLLVPPHLHYPYDKGYTQLFKELEFGEDIPSLMGEKLTYGGESVFIKSEESLQTILNNFVAESGENIQISIFDDGSTDVLVENFIKKYNLEYKVYTFSTLTEYIVYK